jgi:peroxiredoxin
MLNVGDAAPDFELKSHLDKDKKVKLSDLRGKNVVIAFYPLDWTPV